MYQPVVIEQARASLAAVKEQSQKQLASVNEEKQKLAEKYSKANEEVIFLL